MTIESKVNGSSQDLEIIKDQAFEILNVKNAILSDDFFHNKKLIKLSLFPKFLLLQANQHEFQNSSKKLSINISFALKAQIIQEEKENPQSKIVGFNLFSLQDQKQEFIICQQQKIYLWIKQLRKNITLTNFSTHFIPKRALGSGEYSEVFQVQRIKDKKHFAVKRINKRISFSQINGQQSVQNQISILRSLPIHSNLVQVKAVYQSQKSIFILQKLIDGQTLQNFLFQKQYKLEKKQIKKIIQGILEALKTLQQLNIIHRDLKPGNIIIEKDCNPVIIDFGLSVKIIGQNQKFQICGSPGFIAPQILIQKEQNQINQKSDIFSLGCIFYFLLIGRTLFGGQNTDQIFLKNKDCKINWNAQEFSSLTEEQLDLLKKMLNQSPKQRISASQALLHDYFHQIKPLTKSLDQYLKQSLQLSQSSYSSSKNYDLKLKNQKSKFQELFDETIQITFKNDQILKQINFQNQQNKRQNIFEKQKEKLHFSLLNKEIQNQFNLHKVLKAKNTFQWKNIYTFSSNLAKGFKFGKNS